MTRTPEQQRAIVDRILAAWLRMPALRFGQLVNAAADGAEHDPFYIRDEALCEAAEALTKGEPPEPDDAAHRIARDVKRGLTHLSPDLQAKIDGVLRAATREPPAETGEQK